MKPNQPITIVGGGLAGLTLGIALRQQQVPVTVWEAGGYPRHRVCGEFISGRGRKVLEQLGLREKLAAAGAREALTARFYTTRRGTPMRALPQPALCLSRFKLDALLAEEFTRLGGELKEQARWTGDWTTPGVVRATGRQAIKPDQGRRWFGLKAHASGVTLTADLEMHLQPEGYLGLCRLDDDTVNVCGLFSKPDTASLPAGAPGVERLRGAPGSPLRQRLAHAQFNPASCCAVAGLDLHPHRARARDECVIGDALTMIPPLTGNGMSMAFEAASVSVPHLLAYATRRATWNEAQRRLAIALDQRFGRRLGWAGWAHRAMATRGLPAILLPVSLRVPWLWRSWFQLTR